jgi:hypothetical protein
MSSFEEMRLDYLNRARQARDLASTTRDSEVRAGWLKFADTYDELADECRDFAQGKTPNYKEERQ